MPSVNRKWLPPALIALAAGVSVAVYRRLPPLVELPLGGLLPFDVTPAAEPAPRWGALFLMPVLALITWGAFRWAPTSAGQRLGRRMFRKAPQAVTSRDQFDRFGKTYDAIVLGVVMLFIGFHGSVLAAAFERPVLAARIVSVVLGGCLVLMGNVMPRLRPNWVAGLRTKRMLEDPLLWRNAHRAFGAAWVVSGVATMVVGVLAPRYGLAVCIGLLTVSLLVALAASARKSGKASHSAV